MAYGRLAVNDYNGIGCPVGQHMSPHTVFFGNVRLEEEMPSGPVTENTEHVVHCRSKNL